MALWAERRPGLHERKRASDHDRLAMWRRFPMRPVPWCDAPTRNPVHRATARCAVKDESAQLSFEIGLHVQEFEAQHLRLQRHWM